MLAEGCLYIPATWWLVTLPGLAVMATIYPSTCWKTGRAMSSIPGIETGNHQKGHVVDKVLVLGLGRQGKAAVHDLEQENLVSKIVVADITLDAA